MDWGQTVSLSTSHKNLTLVKLKMSDAEILFEWQSQPSTRIYCKSPAIPEWEEHLEWLTQKLREPHQELFIIMHDGLPAGFLRLENTQHNQYEVSVLVAPDFYRMGIAEGALRIIHACKKPAIFDAYILPDNKKSRQLFEKIGYKSISGNVYRFENI